ncbi:MAG TPA: cytochrome c [Candidatus Deferrimicrobiaceae bacterium]|nr:cytochrome c [Candidatus Deferrimicrobiaceae bacterium]
MSRYFIPAVLAATISGLAVVLIWGIVARSPETHANVRPEGFDRTPISYVGLDSTFTGVGLAEPAPVADPANRGRFLFFGFGCATCHGLRGEGGVVGPALDPEELGLGGLRSDIRRGPGGMPAFDPQVVGDEDLEAIFRYLESLARPDTGG